MNQVSPSEVQSRTGGCLCGAVRFSCRVPTRALQACHCQQCQRWTGGGPLVVVSVEDLKIEDDTAVCRYRASDWGERSFCSRCGSTLYWSVQNKNTNSVAVGLLDDQSGFEMTEEIFVDRRPGWLPVWPDASQSTEEQELAKLQEFLDGDKQ